MTDNTNYAEIFSMRFENLGSWVEEAHGHIDDEGRGRHATLGLVEKILNKAMSFSEDADSQLPAKIVGRPYNMSHLALVAREMAIKKGVKALGIDYGEFTSFRMQLAALDIYARGIKIAEIERYGENEGLSKGGLEVDDSVAREELEKQLAAVDVVNPGLREQIETHGISEHNFMALIKGRINLPRVRGQLSQSEISEMRRRKAAAFGAYP